MTKERTAPQSPEDMAKAAQEAAVKAAMEQAQSMFGSIPGFQIPESMQEQIMTQMTAGIPNMAEIQAQQEAMLKAAGIGMETVAEAGRQNMAFAQQMMQGFYDMENLDEEWTISKAGDGKLDAGQLRLLAFGAPMLVYNDENVDTIDCENDIDSIKCTLREWWNVTDRESTLDIVRWLLEEGHHAEADRALAKIRKRGLENMSAEEHCNGDDKMKDVCLIAEEMQKNHSGLAHGGFVIHSGSTGPDNENTNIIEYRLKLDSNPEFTGSVLTAVARAVYRMSQEGQTGCRTMLDIPPAYLSTKTTEEFLKNML